MARISPNIRPSSVGSGFAAAVLPVSSTVIATDDADISVSDVKIPTADGFIPGYCARPIDGSDLPAVVVVHEIFGVHEHIKDVCRRFAKAGYIAVAPELFVRQGDASQIADFGKLIAEIVSKIADSQVLSDIDATISAVVKQLGADASRIAITGFCWGGRIVWLYSSHSDKVKAGGAFYGRLIGQPTDLQPLFPVDVVGLLKNPVRGYYGGEDQGIPIETVETMKALLSAANSKSEIKVYPDAGHAFFADYRPSYNPSAAADAWEDLLGFFAANGV